MTDLGTARDPGVYTRAQLLALDYDDAALAGAVRAGLLRRLRSGWYANGSAHVEVVAAVKGGGALACVSALRFHGLWVPPGHGELHLRRARGMRGKKSSCRGYGAPPPVRRPVDPVPWALSCAVRCLPADEWVAVCDSYFQQTGTGPDDLRGVLGRISAPMNELLAKTDRRSQSGTESIVRMRLRALGYQVVVQPNIPGVGHADLRIGRLLIECDGRQYHSDADQFRTDRRRDRKALADGWVVMRLTYDDVFFGWDEVLADIREITANRRHRVRGGRAADAVRKSVEMDRSEEAAAAEPQFGAPIGRGSSSSGTDTSEHDEDLSL